MEAVRLALPRRLFQPGQQSGIAARCVDLAPGDEQGVDFYVHVAERLIDHDPHSG